MGKLKTYTYREILDLVRNLIHDLVLSHTIGIMIAPKADNDQSILLAENGLVDVPACAQMRKNDGTHVNVLVEGEKLGLRMEESV
jgi:hypothetical protein